MYRVSSNNVEPGTLHGCGVCGSAESAHRTGISGFDRVEGMPPGLSSQSHRSTMIIYDLLLPSTIIYPHPMVKNTLSDLSACVSVSVTIFLQALK